MTRRVVCGLLVVLSACGFEARFDGDYRCDDNHACPSGTICGADGHCARGGEDGDAGDPADGGGDGGGPAACGTTDALRDDWSGQASADLRWVCSGTISVEDDHLRASLPADTEAYAECTSRRFYRLSSSGVSVSPQTSSDDVEAMLAITLPSGVEYRMFTFDGALRVARVEGDSFDDLLGVDHDATDDARWRVRESGGVLRFETASADGDFVQRATSDQDELPAYVTARLSGYGPDSRTEDGAVRFGPVNAEVAAPLCRASSLVDTFDAGAAAEARWSTLGGDGICTQERGDGVLQLGSVGGLDHCGIGSRMGYDLTDDVLAVEAVATGDGNPTLLVEVDGADGRWYRFRISGSPKDLVAESGGPGNTSSTTVDYSERDHRFWRFHHQGSTMRWEVSADGESWEALHQREGVVDPSDMQVQLYCQSLTALDPTILELDDLNAP